MTVAVVVITYNRAAVLRQCLEHLQQQTSAPDEIVVVDSSPGNESQHLVLQFPGVLYVRYRGGRHQMPTARNLGLLRTRSEVVAYIDDDCLVAPDWLAALRAGYARHPEAAGVGGLIEDARFTWDPEGPIGTVDGVGNVYSNFFGDPGYLPAVDCLPGGNMSFRREWLMRVGGFDPLYIGTNHREDPDLCMRIRLQGGELRYAGAAVAHHLNARNLLSELTPWHEFFFRYSFARNEAYFVIKLFGNNPRAVWRMLVPDSLSFLRRALKSRSPVVLATVPVFFFAKAVGLLAGALHRVRVARGKDPSQQILSRLTGRPDSR